MYIIIYYIIYIIVFYIHYAEVVPKTKHFTLLFVCSMVKGITMEGIILRVIKKMETKTPNFNFQNNWRKCRKLKRESKIVENKSYYLIWFNLPFLFKSRRNRKTNLK